MVDRKTVLEALERIAPVHIAESWDNCGMQIDLGFDEIGKILVCLEITRSVIEEAVNEKVDLIVTHHPLYFHESKNVISGTTPGDYTIELIRNGISVYSSHTCFDKVEGGNNTTLCRMLGLEKLEKMKESDSENDYVGYTAFIPDNGVTCDEFVNRVKAVLTLENGEIRFAGDGQRTVKKIGVCTGAGADLMFLAKNYGCDVLLTGDVKYHDAQIAKELGIVLIDAGHYGTEAIFAGNMADKLTSELGNSVEILVSNVNINPFSVK